MCSGNQQCLYTLAADVDHYATDTQILKCKEGGGEGTHSSPKHNSQQPQVSVYLWTGVVETTSPAALPQDNVHVLSALTVVTSVMLVLGQRDPCCLLRHAHAHFHCRLLLTDTCQAPLVSGKPKQNTRYVTRRVKIPRTP